MAKSRVACRDCGGPKPYGPGRRLCNDCLAKVVQKRREEGKQRGRKSYLKNREKVLARARQQRQDPDYVERKRIAALEWAQKHPDRVRANHRRGWAKRKYGLTLEELETILAQGCAICGTHQGSVVGKRGNIPGSPGTRLCIDHSHANGKVRDALCHSCNAGLGNFKDDPVLLRRAAKYVADHQKQNGQLRLA